MFIVNVTAKHLMILYSFITFYTNIICCVILYNNILGGKLILTTFQNIINLAVQRCTYILCSENELKV